MRTLLLPGWQNSGPDHWQSHWERELGFERVEQSDWQWPRRGDWMARLDDMLLASPSSVVLVAHSLGCQLVASWAAHSQHTAKVHCALLVAVPDTERADMPPQLHNWRPITRQALPFRGAMLFSNDDPYCERERALWMAQQWGIQATDIGPHGHVNTESKLGSWPQALRYLQGLGQMSETMPIW